MKPRQHEINRLGFILLPGILFAIGILAGCSLAPASTDPVARIGVVAPFDGRHRDIGYDLVYAARLAIREWNAKGGVEGYRLELIALDDAADPVIAIRAAQTLAVDEDVFGAVGHWQLETTDAARPIYVRASLPLIEMTGQELHEAALPVTFQDDYQAVTPFGAPPGPYAGSAYVACNQLIEAIGQAIKTEGKPTREGVARALNASAPQ